MRRDAAAARLVDLKIRPDHLERCHAPRIAAIAARQLSLGRAVPRSATAHGPCQLGFEHRLQHASRQR